MEMGDGRRNEHEICRKIHKKTLNTEHWALNGWWWLQVKVMRMRKCHQTPSSMPSILHPKTNRTQFRWVFVVQYYIWNCNAFKRNFNKKKLCGYCVLVVFFFLVSLSASHRYYPAPSMRYKIILLLLSRDCWHSYVIIYGYETIVDGRRSTVGDGEMCRDISVPFHLPQVLTKGIV